MEYAWRDLLKEAVEKPGVISEAYTAFHDYSLGNQMLALMECRRRGIQAGPIATYQRWKERNRWVKRGEKAISLCMPVTVKDREDPDETKQVFVFKPRWFVLSQTEGDEFKAPEIPGWSCSVALLQLGIKHKPFDLTDGNCQGYAQGNEIAVNPVAANPMKTTLHEIAHVILGHTAEGQLTDDERTPKNIKEVEAEGVTYILLSVLNLPGAEFSRGYIQHWETEITEKSAMRIYSAADRILKAGRGENAVFEH